MLKKDDQVTIEIEDIGTDGAGIGKADGYTLFVKDAVIGDIIKAKVIKAKKTYGYARLMEIITPSKDRVEPVCPVARQCGGCQIQQMSYSAQLKYKQKLVRDNLARIGGITDCEVLPVIGMENPFNYRNKAQYPVGRNKDGKVVIGFYAGRTHSIIPQTDCLIQHECNKQIVETVLEFMKKYKVTAYDEKKNKGIVRHILTRVGKTTGEVMVCLIINAKKLPYPEEFVEMIRNCGINLEIKSITVNINREKTNVILGEKIETLYGHSYIEDYIGDIKYRISPLSFYQVNPEQTKKLYQTALEFADIKESEVVWDLYCGIGTISLFMAQTAAKVCGVEIVPQAIEDAKQNAELNHMTNTEFFVGAAEDVVPTQYEKSGGKLRADVVTIDPPRKGCDEKLLETVVKMAPSRIVYVSCDPGTLARDVKVLVERGYEVKRVRACDMFGGSFHVETVVGLQRKSM